MKKSIFYKIVGCIIIVLGVIGSLIDGVKIGDILGAFYYGEISEITFHWFIRGALTSILLGLIFIGIGSIMKSIEGLKNDGNRHEKHEINEKESSAEAFYLWTCVSCGKRNHISNTVCDKCGCKR